MSVVIVSSSDDILAHLLISLWFAVYLRSTQSVGEDDWTKGLHAVRCLDTSFKSSHWCSEVTEAIHFGTLKEGLPIRAHSLITPNPYHKLTCSKLFHSTFKKSSPDLVHPLS